MSFKKGLLQKYQYKALGGDNKNSTNVFPVSFKRDEAWDMI